MADRSAQEDQDMLSELAERLGLDDDETDSFIGDAMKRLGYRARRMWEDGDDDDRGRGGGDTFSVRRNRSSRDIPRGRGSSRRSGFGQSQYGA